MSLMLILRQFMSSNLKETFRLSNLNIFQASIDDYRPKKIMKRVKQLVYSVFNGLDTTFIPFYLRYRKEKSCLIAILLHGVFRDKEAIDPTLVDPQQKVTLEYLTAFIEYFKKNEYRFVSPDQIAAGLDVDKKYILLTFDDGYYNNVNALPVLRQYEVPAVFFISTNYVKRDRSFWGDVMYRERTKEGKTSGEIYAEKGSLKSLRHCEIEAYVERNFGEKAFKPIGDIDRPFTPSELATFSKEEYVYLGNHTSDHAILSNYSREEVRDQIDKGQQDLFEMTGLRPDIISFPNGGFSEEVLDVAVEAGLRIGITTVQQKTALPTTPMKNGLILLSRFTLWGDRQLDKQCALYRSDWQLTSTARRLLKRKQ